MLMRLVYFAISFVVIILMTVSCSNDLTSSDENIDDPSGTITVSMRNSGNGDTRLHIGGINNTATLYVSNDNFRCYDAYIVSLGKVKGLGSITTMPTSGWADKMAAIPGNGYIIVTCLAEVYRVYVVDYIYNIYNEIIGVDIKYQPDFRPKVSAEEIQLSSTNATMFYSSYYMPNYYTHEFRFGMLSIPLANSFIPKCEFTAKGDAFDDISLRTDLNNGKLQNSLYVERFPEFYDTYDMTFEDENISLNSGVGKEAILTVHFERK